MELDDVLELVTIVITIHQVLHQEQWYNRHDERDVEHDALAILLPITLVVPLADLTEPVVVRHIEHQAKCPDDQVSIGCHFSSLASWLGFQLSKEPTIICSFFAQLNSLSTLSKCIRSVTSTKHANYTTFVSFCQYSLSVHIKTRVCFGPGFSLFYSRAVSLLNGFA